MDKSRRIFIDLDTCPKKRRIIGFRHKKYHGLIGNARHENPHIHAALGCRAERVLHLITDQQIGRRNVDVILRLIQDVDIDILPQLLKIKRRIGVRQHVAVALKWFRMPAMRIINFEIRLRLPECVPHFQKHHTEIKDSLSMNSDSCIFPVSEPHLPVNVFIRQVNAAIVSRMSVNDQNLPVVAVIHSQGPEGHKPIKCHAFDAFCFHDPCIMHREQ